WVAGVVPERTRDRQPRERGALLASLVPPRQTLYLFGAKDEGILFYYGRPAQRLAGPDHLPANSELVYCMMTEAEWRRQTFRREGEAPAEPRPGSAGASPSPAEAMARFP